MIFEVTAAVDHIIINGTRVDRPKHVSQAEWDHFCTAVVRGAQYR